MRYFLCYKEKGKIGKQKADHIHRMTDLIAGRGEIEKEKKTGPCRHNAAEPPSQQPCTAV